MLLWPVLALAALAYAPSVILNGYVQWDDALLYVHNPLVQSVTLANIVGSFTTYDPEIYVPFTLLTYMAENALFGAVPQVSHGINLLLHLLNILLVHRVLRSHVSERIAWIAALLWAVHPLNVETVVWASARKDLLAATFIFATMLLYEGGRKLSALSYTFACLSKPGAVALPPALLFLDLLKGRRLSRLLVPLFGVAFVFGIIALNAPADTMDIGRIILVFPKALLLPLSKIFVPFPLSAIYAYAGEPVWPWTIALVIIAAAVLGSLQRTNAVILGFGWYGITILPHLLNKNAESAYIRADHYAYVPSLGIIVLIACVYARLFQKDAVVWAVALCMVFLTYMQSTVWHDTGSLFRNVITHYNNSSLAYANVAQEEIRAKDFAAAQELLEQSLRVRPNSLAYFRFADIAIERGDYAAAETLLRKAIEVQTFLERPQDLYADMGAILLLRNNPEAVIYLKKALEIEPAHSQASDNLRFARARFPQAE